MNVLYVWSANLTTILFVFFSLVAGYNLNIGCCTIQKVERNYSLISRLAYLSKVSDGAKKTFLRDFENYVDEKNELQEDDIRKCYKTDPTTTKPTIPVKSQAKIAQTLLDKKKNKHVFSLFGCLSDLHSLILPGVEVGK